MTKTPKELKHEYYLRNKQKWHDKYYLPKRKATLDKRKRQYAEGKLWSQQPKNKQAALEIKRRFNAKWKEKRDQKAQEYYVENRQQILEQKRLYAKLNPQKIKARNAVSNSELPHSFCCVLCGVTENLTHHHPDYSKPLEVVTLCSSCNIRIEKSPESQQMKAELKKIMCEAIF